MTAGASRQFHNVSSSPILRVRNWTRCRDASTDTFMHDVELKLPNARKRRTCGSFAGRSTPPHRTSPSIVELADQSPTLPLSCLSHCLDNINPLTPRGKKLLHRSTPFDSSAHSSGPTPWLALSLCTATETLSLLVVGTRSRYYLKTRLSLVHPSPERQVSTQRLCTSSHNTTLTLDTTLNQSYFFKLESFRLVPQ